jgi:hypothetical protein
MLAALAVAMHLQPQVVIGTLVPLLAKIVKKG